MKDKGSYSLWQNRDFLFMWGGQAVSMIGSQVSAFVLPFLALALTKSPLQAGLIVTIQQIPYLILGLPAGALIDRWNRKNVMIACDIIRCFAYASIPLASIFGKITLQHIYLVALIGGVAFVFFDVADGASFPRIVSPKQLSNAAAFMEGTTSASELVGPVIGGLFLSLATQIIRGAVLAYLADSLSFLISVIGLFCIRTSFQGERQQQVSRIFYQEITTGIRFLWMHSRLRALAFLTACISILLSSVVLAVIVLAQKDLRASGFTIGLIFGIGGVGGLLGAFIVPWFSKHIPRNFILSGSVAFWAISTFILALANSPFILVIAWVIFTLSMPLYFSTTYAYRISLVPDHFQGRVNSIYRLLALGGSALGSALGGLLLTLIGSRIELAIITSSLVLCFVLIICTRLAGEDELVGRR